MEEKKNSYEEIEKKMTDGSVTLKLRYCPNCEEHKLLIPATDDDGKRCEKCLYCHEYVYRHGDGEENPTESVI